MNKEEQGDREGQGARGAWCYVGSRGTLRAIRNIRGRARFFKRAAYFLKGGLGKLEARGESILRRFFRNVGGLIPHLGDDGIRGSQCTFSYLDL